MRERRGWNCVLQILAKHEMYGERRRRGGERRGGDRGRIGGRGGACHDMNNGGKFGGEGDDPE